MDSKTLRTLTVYVVWVMLIIKWVSTSLVNRKHCINKKYQTVWDAELSLGLLSLLLTLLPLRLPRWHYFDEPLWSSGVSKVAGVASLLFKTEFPKTADSESSSVSTQWGALSRGGGGFTWTKHTGLYVPGCLRITFQKAVWWSVHSPPVDRLHGRSNHNELAWKPRVEGTALWC